LPTANTPREYSFWGHLCQAIVPRIDLLEGGIIRKPLRHIGELELMFMALAHGTVGNERMGNHDEVDAKLSRIVCEFTITDF